MAGKYWSVLNSDVAADLGAVRSVAIAAAVSGSKVTYKVSMGGQGYAAGIVEVNMSSAPTPTPSPGGEEGGETGGEAGGGTTLPREIRQPITMNLMTPVSD